MKTNEDNIIVAKSKTFAVRIIRATNFLKYNKREFTMSQQLLRSGTSIGANIKEAIRGQTKADFAFKMNIALKEASETEYWLEILDETHYFTSPQAESLLRDCREILRILTAITRTSYDSPQG